MPTVPITRSVTARWDRPRYELLDARGSILEALAEITAVAGFRPSHDSMFVDLVDGIHLDVTLGDVTAISAVPSNSGIYRPHVQAVANVLGASMVVGAAFALQHLISWSGEEESATAQAVAATAISGVESSTDCAAVIDGVTAGWQYKAEFGVVDVKEIPDRVARRVGRAAGPVLNDEIVVSSEFPQVATFVDSYWKATEPWDVTLDEGWRVADAVDELALQLAYDLHNHLRRRVEGRLRDGA